MAGQTLLANDDDYQRFILEHLYQFGPFCPGFEREPHKLTMETTTVVDIATDDLDGQFVVCTDCAAAIARGLNSKDITS